MERTNVGGEENGSGKVGKEKEGEWEGERETWKEKEREGKGRARREYWISEREYNTVDVVNAYCVHNGRLGAVYPILVLFEYAVDRFTNERQSIYDQVINLKSMVCLLAKQRTAFK